MRYYIVYIYSLVFAFLKIISILFLINTFYLKKNNFTNIVWYPSKSS